jgi:raffinose/stachyose/melibiose transport system permease protein
MTMSAKVQSWSLHKKQNLTAYLFLLPLAMIFAVFLVYSFYFLIRNSFNFVTISFQNPKFVGWNNYKTVLGDPIFYRAVFNTFLLSSASIFAGLTLGFLISVFLGFNFRGRKFFHALFFIPAMLPMAFVAVVFSLMLEYNDGLINNIVRFLHLGFLDLRYLSDPKLAMFSVMSVSIFLIGIPVMYYTADLSTMSTSVFEAAIIDGAGMKEILFLILYPLMKNTHKTIALSMLLGGFREMERVYLMTDGGPGGVTQIVGSYIYISARFAGSNLGFVAATAVLILIVALLISLLQLKFYARSTGR